MRSPSRIKGLLSGVRRYIAKATPTGMIVASTYMSGELISILSVRILAVQNTDMSATNLLGAYRRIREGGAVTAANRLRLKCPVKVSVTPGFSGDNRAQQRMFLKA